MGITTIKGEIGEAMVIADLRKRGFGIAIPFGHDVPFDVVLYRNETDSLERVQVKYTESDGRVVKIKCRSSSDWVEYRYTATDIDWIATYDATSECCYYVHSTVFDGLSELRLRLAPTSNGQVRRIRWASDHLSPDPPTRETPAGGLPFPTLPE